MALVILHKDGLFNVMGTVRRVPVFQHPVSEQEVKRYLMGMFTDRELAAHIQYAKQFGTSSRKSLPAFLQDNKAGANGSALSITAFENKYLKKS